MIFNMVDGAPEFLSTPSGWRATSSDGVHPIQYGYISIHALRVEGDFLFSDYSILGICISIHALRVEGDCTTHHVVIIPDVFLSTPSGWRATCNFDISNLVDEFLSTPSGWRATFSNGSLTLSCYISIHALRVEGDSVTRAEWADAGQFLSTPSGWRATISAPADTISVIISIHALRVEGDSVTRNGGSHKTIFLSTPSGWRATDVAIDDRHCARISIHALRVEGDARACP